MNTVTSFETVEIPVKLCKRGRKADAGKLLRERPDLIERTEFEPDNSRIGNESKGLQSQVIGILNPAWSLSTHYMAEAGIVPIYPRVIITGENNGK